MRSDGAPAGLRDIAYHIALGRRFVADIDLDTFQNDIRTRYAVTRCLEIISEASRRIPDEIKARHPSIAWKEMAAAGNIHRQEFEDVAARLVRDTVQLAFPSLENAIAQEPAAHE